MDGRRIVLIDTPGFGNESRTDVDILEDIAKWMAKKGYLTGKNQLDGLILLHPVTMHRPDGDARKRTKLLQNFLGQNAYKRVIIATTKWEILKDDNDVNSGLKAWEKDIWYDLVRQGVKIRKHYNNPVSALCIIEEIIALSQKYGKLEPLIQTELVKDPRLIKTTASKSKKDLQADIVRARTLLADHDRTRPREPRQRDKVIQNKKWKEFEEWYEERKVLEDRLEKLETSLSELTVFHVSWATLTPFFRKSPCAST